MRVEVVFLGTSSTIPTAERNHSAIYLRYGADRMLFDCGEGTQRQMTIAKLSAMKLKYIFITHMDGDHFLGLPGILQTCSMREREAPLEIFGPKGIKKHVKLAIDLSPFNLSFDVNIHESDDRIIVENEQYLIKTFPVIHREHSVGYAFIEKDIININEEKLKRIGIKPGPLYRKIKEGKEIEWQGKKISPEDYIIRKKGIKIVYSGDTAYCERVIKESENADILIHEATFAQDIKQRAIETKHSTARDAGLVARQANVKQLVLTHFSSRYKNEELHKLLNDAKKEFDNVILAKDFMRIEI
ncbi:MAG: ribonuclease Z [Candidatus Diapherotrites archaeon]|nr:ribonuclease Z [Candidatus Diapherotrites archaeon]